MLGARVPAALIVQMAASRAEIGPFAGAGRATPAEAARAYRQAAQPAPRLSGQPTQRRS
ncbi:hypothetical protein ABE438_05775 [Bosea sp. TWI1241]|uniref:hypothetical protein n=1 Tax=Bosea sp. TWI1241 TaxID=3148904 RepID=UPI0032080A20